MDTSKTPRLYEEIASEISEKIRSGELKAGDRLPSERTLAEKYGVSRAVIRESLRALEMTGCVESRVGAGTRIRVPSVSSLADPLSTAVALNGSLGGELIEVRRILETETAVLAARRRTEQQLTALEATIADMRADLERGGMGLEADERFHAILARAAGNSALNTMLEMCSGMLSGTRAITQAVKGAADMTLEDHGDILEAVRAQDERAARRLMRRHLDRALKNLSIAAKEE